MTLHVLKCHPEPFREVRAGRKRHETRSEADRDFSVGDAMILCEWVPETGLYTGAVELVQVTYLSRGPDWGLPVGVAVMSVKKVAIVVGIDSNLDLASRHEWVVLVRREDGTWESYPRDSLKDARDFKDRFVGRWAGSHVLHIVEGERVELVDCGPN